MIRVSQIRLSPDAPREELKKKLLKKTGLSESELISWKIFKQSVDARRKGKLHFVYTLLIEVKNEKALLSRTKDPNISPAPELHWHPVLTSRHSNEPRPVVVGAGPAGLFAALLLARAGYKPLLIERGHSVEQRARDVKKFFNGGPLDPESNIQFGEGGAGTFSDGKLYTQIKDTRTRFVVDEMVKHGAPEDILYSFKPHIGSDRLPRVVKSLRQSITEAGGEVRFESRLTALHIENSRLNTIEINENEMITCTRLILAVGHSARDTYAMLEKSGVEMQAKIFAIGLRIEHLQKDIDRAQYGSFATHPMLKAAPYKLVHHSDSARTAFSFCMCPGGTVVAAASEPGYLVTNGMSEYSRDRNNANAALLVNVGPEDFGEKPLDAVAFQRKWESRAFQKGGENYHAPVQLVGDFLKDRASDGPGHIIPSYRPGVTWTTLHDCLPETVIQSLKEAINGMARKLKGFNDPEAVLTGVETRSSSPLRIPRDEHFQANIRGLYPCGEGAGYAGGIISAAVDGLKCAEALCNNT